MAEDRTEVAIDIRVRLKTLERPLIAGRALKKNAFAADGLLDDAFHRAGIIGSDEAVGRAHNSWMAGVVNQRGERFAVGRIELNDDDFVVARTVGVDASKSLAARCYCPALGVDMTVAPSRTNPTGLKIPQCLDRGLGRPARDIVEPW